ncbi:MAG: hypothetical protein WD469_12455 [Paenibacillaceae bacterium]
MKSFYGQLNQGREPDRIDKWMSHRHAKLLRSWVWPFSTEKQFITAGISGRAKV